MRLKPPASRPRLPHIDLHAPANTLRSLADLEPYLAKL
jgi:hypothetical protein